MKSQFFLLLALILTGLSVGRAFAEPYVLKDWRGWFSEEANTAVLFTLVKENNQIYRGKYEISLTLIYAYTDYDNKTGRVKYYNNPPKLISEKFKINEEQHFLRKGYWLVEGVYIPKYPNINLLKQTITFSNFNNTANVYLPVKLTDLTFYAKDYGFTPASGIKFEISTPYGKEYRFTDSEGKAIFTDVYSENIKLISPNFKQKTDIEFMDSLTYYFPSVYPLLYAFFLTIPTFLLITMFFGFSTVANFVLINLTNVYIFLYNKYFRLRRWFRWRK
jgi:hypothetical protein